MVLVDTGPLVAWFNPADAYHAQSVERLRAIHAPLATTVAVLTEAFHLLGPANRGSDGLRDFVAREGVGIWFFDAAGLARAFELMEAYADHPMDLADASLVTAAERLGTRKVMTIDRSDFLSYRVRIGHRHYPMELE